MNIAIIEDDCAQRETLQQMVHAWLSREVPTGKSRAFADAERFLFAREDEHFDLLLVDIHLPGKSGMQLVENLRSKGVETAVVFITAESGFVFQGYKVNALDYLLKPVSPQELAAVLDKAKNQIGKKEPCLLVDDDGVLKEIPVSAIHYLEVFGHVCTLYYNPPGNAQDTPLGAFASRDSLQTWKNRLEDLVGEGVFISPHRSFLAHLGWITRISRTDLKMADGTFIPIARGRWEAVSKAWLAYRRERVG